MKSATLSALLIVASFSIPVFAEPAAPEYAVPAASPVLSYAITVDAAPAVPMRAERKSPMLNDRETDTRRGG